MKKYISFSVLLCICIALVGVILWQFRGLALGDNGDGAPDGTGDVPAIATGDTTPAATTPADTTPAVTEPPAPEPPKTVELDLAGTYLSRHITSLTLRTEWAVYRSATSPDVYFSAEIYLDGDVLALPAGKSGYVTVAGQTASFSAPEIALADGRSVRLGTVSFRIPCEERGDEELPLLVSFDIDATHGGVQYESITLSGTVAVTDRYGELESKVEWDVPASDANVLPSGSAVLSLASLLNYYGLEADPVVLSDKYLDKMPAGFASPEEANVGNPKNEFNSYECHAPVLVQAAERYLAALGSSLTAEDRTGSNTLSLLLTLSEGDPLIVWMPADAEKGPTLSQSWIIGGESVTMNEIRCAVLCGYDQTANTVTLVYPGEEATVMDLALFEEWFLRMGAQCVALR